MLTKDALFPMLYNVDTCGGPQFENTIAKYCIQSPDLKNTPRFPYCLKPVATDLARKQFHPSVPVLRFHGLCQIQVS